MARSVILVDGQRGKVIDIDSGATADATVTVERKRRDSTGIALQLVGAVVVFAILCTFGWPGLLLILFLPMLGRL
jgi:hypothetical protein